MLKIIILIFLLMDAFVFLIIDFHKNDKDSILYKFMDFLFKKLELDKE